MPRGARWTAGLLPVAILIALPAVSGPYVVGLGLLLLLAFVLAQSWDWIAGEAGYINLGHFVFYGIGAYAFSILLVWGLPLPACFAAAGVVGAVAAVIVAFPLFRLHGDYFAFGTLALR